MISTCNAPSWHLYSRRRALRNHGLRRPRRDSLLPSVGHILKLPARCAGIGEFNFMQTELAWCAAPDCSKLTLPFAGQRQTRQGAVETGPRLPQGEGRRDEPWFPPKPLELGLGEPVQEMGSFP